MNQRNATRYCADPEALGALKRDGMGWGHDLECGCFHDHTPVSRPSLTARILTALRKRG